jgi:hypothetical protein
MEVGNGLPDDSAALRSGCAGLMTAARSWGNWVVVSLGKAGEYLTSIQFQRLGYARDRVFELSWSARSRLRLMAHGSTYRGLEHEYADQLSGRWRPVGRSEDRKAVDGLVSALCSRYSIAAAALVAIHRQVMPRRLQSYFSRSNRSRRRYSPDLAIRIADVEAALSACIASMRESEPESFVPTHGIQDAPDLHASRRRRCANGFMSSGDKAKLDGMTATVEDKFVAGTGFTAGTTTSLTLSKTYASAAAVMVHFDGAFQGSDQYTISGNTITFTSADPDGTQTVYARG